MIMAEVLRIILFISALTTALTLRDSHDTEDVIKLGSGRRFFEIEKSKISHLDGKGPQDRHCICQVFDPNENKITVSEYLDPYKNPAERLVLYLYRVNGKVHLYIPTAEKQNLLPDLSLDDNDVLQEIVAKPFTDLLENSPYVITKENYENLPDDDIVVPKTNKDRYNFVIYKDELQDRLAAYEDPVAFFLQLITREKYPNGIPPSLLMLLESLLEPSDRDHEHLPDKEPQPQSENGTKSDYHNLPYENNTRPFHPFDQSKEQPEILKPLECLECLSSDPDHEITYEPQYPSIDPSEKYFPYVEKVPVSEVYEYPQPNAIQEIPSSYNQMLQPQVAVTNSVPAYPYSQSFGFPKSEVLPFYSEPQSEHLFPKNYIPHDYEFNKNDVIPEFQHQMQPMDYFDFNVPRPVSESQVHPIPLDFELYPESDIQQFQDTSLESLDFDKPSLNPVDKKKQYYNPLSKPAIDYEPEYLKVLRPTVTPSKDSVALWDNEFYPDMEALYGDPSFESFDFEEPTFYPHDENRIKLEPIDKHLQKYNEPLGMKPLQVHLKPDNEFDYELYPDIEFPKVQDTSFESFDFEVPEFYPHHEKAIKLQPIEKQVQNPRELLVMEPLQADLNPNFYPNDEKPIQLQPIEKQVQNPREPLVMEPFQADLNPNFYPNDEKPIQLQPIEKQVQNPREPLVMEPLQVDLKPNFSPNDEKPIQLQPIEKQVQNPREPLVMEPLQADLKPNFYPYDEKPIQLQPIEKQVQRPREPFVIEPLQVDFKPENEYMQPHDHNLYPSVGIQKLQPIDFVTSIESVTEEPVKTDAIPAIQPVQNELYPDIESPKFQDTSLEYILPAYPDSDKFDISSQFPDLSVLPFEVENHWPQDKVEEVTDFPQDTEVELLNSLSPDQMPSRDQLLSWEQRPQGQQLTFDQWFEQELRDLKKPEDLNLYTLKVTIENILKENDFNLTADGILIDKYGTVLNAGNLSLRPLLIGKPLGLKTLLDNDTTKKTKLKLAHTSPYLYSLLVSLRSPSKILGLISLGIKRPKDSSEEFSEDTQPFHALPNFSPEIEMIPSVDTLAKPFPKIDFEDSNYFENSELAETSTTLPTEQDNMKYFNPVTDISSVAPNTKLLPEMVFDVSSPEESFEVPETDWAKNLNKGNLVTDMDSIDVYQEPEVVTEIPLYISTVTEVHQLPDFSENPNYSAEILRPFPHKVSEIVSHDGSEEQPELNYDKNNDYSVTFPPYASTVRPEISTEPSQKFTSNSVENTPLYFTLLNLLTGDAPDLHSQLLMNFDKYPDLFILTLNTILSEHHVIPNVRFKIKQNIEKSILALHKILDNVQDLKILFPNLQKDIENLHYLLSNKYNVYIDFETVSETPVANVSPVAKEVTINEEPYSFVTESNEPYYLTSATPTFVTIPEVTTPRATISYVTEPSVTILDDPLTSSRYVTSSDLETSSPIFEPDTSYNGNIHTTPLYIRLLELLSGDELNLESQLIFLLEENPNQFLPTLNELLLQRDQNPEIRKIKNNVRKFIPSLVLAANEGKVNIPNFKSDIESLYSSLYGKINKMKPHKTKPIPNYGELQENDPSYQTLLRLISGKFQNTPVTEDNPSNDPNLLVQLFGPEKENMVPFLTYSIENPTLLAILTKNYPQLDFKLIAKYLNDLNVHGGKDHQHKLQRLIAYVYPKITRTRTKSKVMLPNLSKETADKILKILQSDPSIKVKTEVITTDEPLNFDFDTKLKRDPSFYQKYIVTPNVKWPIRNVFSYKMGGEDSLAKVFLENKGSAESRADFSDERNVEEDKEKSKEVEVPEEEKVEEDPEFRIIGGSAATGSGAPLSNKGRVGVIA